MKQKKPNLLLIEPDKLLSSVYAEELAKKFTVTPCLTAEKAMSVLAIHKPDIIVLEITLPEYNGLDILYDLQSYTDSKNIPVVILSFINKEDIGMSEQQLHALSVQTHLYKPTVTPKKILQEIQSLKLVTHE